ncbi:hypothetical protein NDU88_003784 [Pleurodeles waltl]|uniref:Uncharacterized protein n=1 Tax=Pleurodeles waltl TaxID=8319 RepID=A0AAV7RGU2_PLEWA|nr:hypothetical protein NDU88_003784 [Pleurodeles waltl]
MVGGARPDRATTQRRSEQEKRKALPTKREATEGLDPAPHPNHTGKTGSREGSGIAGARKSHHPAPDRIETQLKAALGSPLGRQTRSSDTPHTKAKQKRVNSAVTRKGRTPLTASITGERRHQGKDK